MNVCPCGTNINYNDCCGRFIDNQEIPSTPLELMRSRYTAYTQAKINYITNTMKSPAADNFNAEEACIWAKEVKWLKLEIIGTHQENPTKGFVEFKAHYSYQNKKQIMHEKSEFHLENGRWFYVDGASPIPHTVTQSTKISRNDPCPCGSQKKYKKCCGSY